MMFGLLGASPQELVLFEVAKSSISLFSSTPVEVESSFDPNTVFIYAYVRRE